jgi:hypothetical protein
MTSKPARVRLAILIDAEDERLCGKECRFLIAGGQCKLWGEVWDWDTESYVRASSCLSATKAVERDEAIVAAAMAWTKVGGLKEQRAIYESVDAKRADEAKEKPKNG